MFYPMVMLAVIVTVFVFRFIYKKTKSLMFVNSFQLVDDILYKDKLPYSDTIKVQETDGSRVYFDFVDGKLERMSLHIGDGANAHWRTGNKYITCYDKGGNSISQGRFESLYSRFIDANSLLEIFNRNFKKCQLTI